MKRVITVTTRDEAIALARKWANNEYKSDDFKGVIIYVK